VAGLLLVAAAVLATAPQAPQAPGGSQSTAQDEARQRAQATPVFTDHLKVTAYAGDDPVADGGRVSLILDIEPGAGMHVYAPGAEDYQVIALEIAAQPFLKMLPLRYPASEIYVFEPLDERVNVYQKPFSLRQELVLDTQALAAVRGKATVTITGTLEYQACDDRVCFKPVSVPLSWTLNLPRGMLK
jgi:DsbC/DsbD-like thiol-disulfide interchange protein